MGGYAGERPAARDFLKIVDIRTKIVSLSSLLVGSGWALATAPEHFSWLLFALMAMATLAIDMGTTGFNSYFDFLSGVDTRESDIERFKALVQRDLDPRIALHLSLSLYVFAMPLGILIGLRAGWEVVAIGAAVLAWKTLADMNARGWSHATKGPNMAAISLVFLVFTACLLASFALARLL